MKLILANNQSAKFRDFYAQLQSESGVGLEYAGYKSLLFCFNIAGNPMKVLNVESGRSLDEYDGVYINGYLNAYESAAAVAVCSKSLGVPFVNHELDNPPSLSKLSMYAKLAAASVSLPPTICGTKAALLQAGAQNSEGLFPAVLKRADADRGIDNYKVTNFEDVEKLLADFDDRSLWLLQSFIDNDGFYMVCCYDSAPKFSIYRTLEQRPDGNEQKAHMYKPKGGANASLVDIAELPAGVADTCVRAVKAMDRQIASVDCLVDASDGQVYVLEVNYNPQLVTIETFKDARVKAFLEYLAKDWSNLV